MNDSNQNPDPRADRQPPPDKTMVEGQGSAAQPSRLQPGTRINATQLGATNPYGGRGASPVDALPAGDEPIQLGSGTIASVLGTGGMARVYKIWNEKLEVFHAVKVIIPGSGSDLRNRFETEAKITAKLHNPNIVEIYGVGEFNGLPYIEMELIEGESLEAIIARQGKLPDPVAAAIAIFIAEALVYAHGQEFLLYGKNYKGIIHRDLKPANIMIANDGRVKLMDFGIARPTEASLHTVDGNIVGTMQYLSPEQLDGIDIDNRTDLYSLGAILYEMLTGTKTFPQDTITNLMRKKISNEYRKFSEFDFAVSPGLAKVAQKCLQLSKDQRYANADELLKELNSAFRSLVSFSPLQAIKSYLSNPDSATFTARSAKPAWLNKWIFIGAGAVAVAAIAIAVIIATGPKAPEPQAEPPVVNKPAPSTATAGTASGTVPAVPSADNTPEGSLHPLNPSAAALQPEPAANPPAAAARQAAAATARRSTTPKPVSTPTTAKPQSSRDALVAKYKLSDPIEIGKAALNAHAYADAVSALENAQVSGQNTTLRVVLLLEAYVESGRTSDAATLMTASPVNDAEFDVLAGRVYMAQGKNKKALDMYESAITKPSMVHGVTPIRKDALYFTALVRADHYHTSPTAETKAAALAAWNAVIRIYADESGNPRCRQATEELAKLQ